MRTDRRTNAGASHRRSRGRGAAIAATAAVLLAGGPAARATTWLVEADGSGTAPTIAAAMQLSVPGDTVDVGCGTYYEAGIAMKDGVVLTSRTRSPDCATIDGQGLDSVLRFRGVDPAARVIGFTITGGAGAQGGGIDCASASYPTIEDCVVTGNRAGEGGGIFCVHSSPTLRRCRIENNVATRWGGAVSCYDNANAMLEDCTIVGNSAGEFGGGLWTYFFSNPTLVGCVVAGNSAGDTGGGLFLFESLSTLQNCTVLANGANRGGGIALECAKPTIRNTILWDDCAADGRELAILDPVSRADFSCCDVDTSSGWHDGYAAVVLSGDLYSDEPGFCAPISCATGPSPGEEQFTLNGSSTCLAENNGCGVRIGARDASCAAATPAPLAISHGPGTGLSCLPNPFVEATWIAFELPAAAEVDLRVFDVAGRQVRTIEPGRRREAGAYRLLWDGRDSGGRPVASGVYFARFSSGSRRTVERIVRIR